VEKSKRSDEKSPQEENLNKKLYVGGLAYSVTDEQLRQLFQPHGTVESATVITDKFTDASRGFGFVELSTEQEAEAAIAALNGTEHMGRTITVNISRPRESRGGAREGRGGGGGGRW
jgi:RNA recognition motif-containing protein